MIRFLSLLIVGSIVVLLPALAAACKCSGPGRYDLIFEGRVASITEDAANIQTDRYLAVRFQVERVVAGTRQNETTVYTGRVLMCGTTYKVGEKYVVYALDKGYLETKYCYGRESR